MSCSYELFVLCKQDLSKLLQLDRRIKIIKLQLPTLSKKENNEYQKNLNRYHNECGCNIGAFLSVLTISAYILILIIQTIKTGVFTLGWSSIVFLFFLFILSAGIGKFIGIMNAKTKFRNIVRDIERKL